MQTRTKSDEKGQVDARARYPQRIRLRIAAHGEDRAGESKMHGIRCVHGNSRNERSAMRTFTDRESPGEGPACRLPSNW